MSKSPTSKQPAETAPVNQEEPRIAGNESQIPEGIRKNAKFFILVAIAVSLVWLYKASSDYTEQAREDSAMIALSNASTVTAAQETIDSFPETKAVPLARIRLAKLYYNNGNYDRAEAIYKEFNSHHREHPLQPAADLGIAHCLEARGDLQGAIELYSEFIETHESVGFLTPVAKMSKARCLTALGQYTEARVTYEDFIAEQDDTSVWGTLAQEYLKDLEVKIARAEGNL